MNLIIAVFSLIAAFAVANEHRNSTRSVLSDEPEKHHKSENSVCPHKDYRSYVKCLQNHRRHEPQAQAISRGNLNGGVNCMEDCERESCRHQGAGPCVEVCYDRCLKKTKEIHHRITEYETTCGEGEDCENAGKTLLAQGPPAIANLTTSIDIRNYVNNTNVILQTHAKTDEGHQDRKDHENDRDNKGRNNTCKSGQPGCGESGTDDVNRGSGPPPGLPPWFSAPSLTLIPQIQMVPQVTFGIGISPGGGFGSVGSGCPYASVWLCLPQQQQQQQQVRDCSGCVQPYPYSRGRCDPSC